MFDFPITNSARIAAAAEQATVEKRWLVAAARAKFMAIEAAIQRGCVHCEKPVVGVLPSGLPQPLGVLVEQEIDTRIQDSRVISYYPLPWCFECAATSFSITSAVFTGSIRLDASDANTAMSIARIEKRRKDSHAK